ncbi:hypothetical protein LR48_Vigan09g202600 [Vigna angularis]|uniref:Pentatricopeptide repeat-containing protein n=1 Tax=Phaseolus angularis TaxID=3914 RepID=A0A0L9VEK3_PHAAN|nr:pentatricopeptide repeat-containing protein At4g14820 [Vigna angularis]KOM53367.1 hypothetical protein LR48_Vigan09g202600 [Vigna angularis]
MKTKTTKEKKHTWVANSDINNVTAFEEELDKSGSDVTGSAGNTNNLASVGGHSELCSSTLLKVVSKLSSLNMGLKVHSLVSKLGFHDDPFIQTALIAMYTSCGRIMDARLVFDKMSHRDIVTCNIMIDGYSQSGHYDHVLRLYEETKISGMELDSIILFTMLSTCGHAGNLSYDKAIHEFIKDNGFHVDSHLHIALVIMYASCGSMYLAREVYDQLPLNHLVVSTAMFSGYAKIGLAKDACFIFYQIVEKDLVCWSVMISF